MAIFFLGLVFLFAVGMLLLWERYRLLKRERFIRRYVFPPGLFAKLKQKFPQLDDKQCQLVARGLRKYFLAYLRSGRREVAMPSQVVDELWHVFILHTKSYSDFCRQAFGRFFHHTPAVSLSNQGSSNASLRRCWRYCCLEENINPVNPARLPLLFALDRKFNISNGFMYVADCEGLRREGSQLQVGAVHCGGDFSSTSFDGGTDGLSDSSGSSDGDGGGGDSGGGGCGGGD